MSTLQQLNEQRATFIAARQQGKISQEQLNTALAANQKQIDALKASQTTVSATPVTPTAPQQPPQYIPTNMGPVPMKTFEEGAKDPTMQNVVIPGMEVAAIVGLSVIPGAAPVVLSGAAIGVGAKVGIDSVVTSVETGQAQLVLPKTVREVTDTALEGAALSAIGGGAVGAVGKFAPSIVENTIGRVALNTGINAGISAGASGVASGGDSKAILEGAAFGAALGLGGEALGAAAGKVASVPKVANAIQNVRDATIGSKFDMIVGVKEVSIQTTKDDVTLITRTTEPITETVRLRGKDAKFYRENNLGTLDEAKLQLAGTETVKTASRDVAGVPEEITLFNKPIESSRNAQPILDTIQGNDFKLTKKGVGKLGDMVNMPNETNPIFTETGVKGPADLIAAGDTFAKPVKGKVLNPSGPDRDILLVGKRVTAESSSGLPDLRVATRDFTGVEVSGKPQSASKSVVDAFKKPDEALKILDVDLGVKPTGKEISVKDYIDMTKDSGAMKAGSNDAIRKNLVTEKSADYGLFNPDDAVAKRSAKLPSQELTGKAGQSLEFKARETTKADNRIKLDRAIVGEAKADMGIKMPSLYSPIAIRSSTKNKSSPSAIQFPVTEPTLPKNIQPSSLIPGRITPTAPSQIIDVDTPSSFSPKNPLMPVIPVIDNIPKTPNRPIIPDIDNIPKKPNTPIIPVIDNIPSRKIPENYPVVWPVTPVNTNIRTGGGPINFTTNTPKEIPIIKGTPKQTPFTIPTVRIPEPTRKRKNGLYFNMGGGFDLGGKGGNKNGLWFEKKHKIKTPTQMLKTFGVGGLDKPFKKTGRPTRRR